MVPKLPCAAARFPILQSACIAPNPKAMATTLAAMIRPVSTEIHCTEPVIPSWDHSELSRAKVFSSLRSIQTKVEAEGEKVERFSSRGAF